MDLGMRLQVTGYRIYKVAGSPRIFRGFVKFRDPEQ